MYHRFMKWVIAAGLLLLAFVAVISISSLNDFFNAVREGERAHRTRGELDRLYEVLLAAELDQRSYLLSGKPEYLRSYLNRSSQIPVLLDNLNPGDDEENAKKLVQLKQLVQAKLQALDTTLYAARAGAKYVGADIKPKTLPMIRLLLDEMDQAAKNDAVEHERFVQSASSFFVSLIVSASAIATLLFALFWYLVLRESRLHAKTEAELRVAEAAARAASDLKSKFLPAVSHEIRTPLNGIIGMSELLQSRIEDPQQKRFVDIIQSSGETILKIVDDILELSKIEAGAVQLETVQFSVSKLITMAADVLICKARDKGISVLTYADPDIPDQLIGDAPRISQILRNLISNAIKYTRQGSVCAQARLTEKNKAQVVVRFEVADSGLGVPEAQIPLMFEPFYQLMSDEERQDGAGLGLSICKSLVEQMGGRIGVQSQLRKGSVFWFEIPLKTATDTLTGEAIAGPEELKEFAYGHLLLVAETPFLDRVMSEYAAELKMRFRKLRSLTNFRPTVFSSLAPVIVFIDMDNFDLVKLSQEIELARQHTGISIILLTNSEIDELDQNLITPPVIAFLRKPFSREDLQQVLANRSAAQRLQSPRPARVLPAAFPVPRKNGLILLVEDDPVNRILAEAVLNEHGYQIDCVVNGEEAVEAVQRTAYDLILMDCQLPVMSGYEAAKRIRDVEETSGRRVPIIAVTAHASISDRKKCLASGMDDVINKPWKNRELVRTVAKWLGEENESPIDWNTLDELCEKTNASATSRMIDSFLSTLPQALAAIEAETKLKNWPKVKFWAHRLKSSSATLGAKRLSENCKRLEELLEVAGNVSEEQAIPAVQLVLEQGQAAYDSLRHKYYMEAD